MSLPSFEVSMKILDKLLAGKLPKEVAEEEEVSLATISLAKSRFPLFLGLPYSRSKGYK